MNQTKELQNLTFTKQTNLSIKIDETKTNTGEKNWTGRGKNNWRSFKNKHNNN